MLGRKENFYCPLTEGSKKTFSLTITAIAWVLKGCLKDEHLKLIFIVKNKNRRSKVYKICYNTE